MTMVTASTALTIFIMNIHHCGSEARPVPQWAECFILHYLAKICFVYEVGENCLTGCSASQEQTSQVSDNTSADFESGTNWDVNGKAGGGGGSGRNEADASKTDTLFVTINQLEEKEGSGQEAKAQESNSSHKGGGRGFEQTSSSEGDVDGSKEPPVSSRCSCNNKELFQNVAYITGSYQEQRVAQLRIGEWRKVAKVMDRFFMWLFFIMVFIMSILILGKAI